MAAEASNLTNGSEVVGKAGSWYPSGFNVHLGSAMLQAEGTVNFASRYDYSNAGSHDLIGSAYKGFLSDIVSSLTAIQAINFSLDSYPSRIVAEDMINVNRDTALRGLSILRDNKSQEFTGVK